MHLLLQLSFKEVSVYIYYFWSSVFKKKKRKEKRVEIRHRLQVTGTVAWGWHEGVCSLIAALAPWIGLVYLERLGKPRMVWKWAQKSSGSKPLAMGREDPCLSQIQTLQLWEIEWSLAFRGNMLCISWRFLSLTLNIQKFPTSTITNHVQTRISDFEDSRQMP